MIWWTDDPVRDASRWYDYLDEHGVTHDEWERIWKEEHGQYDEGDEE